MRWSSPSVKLTLTLYCKMNAITAKLLQLINYFELVHRSGDKMQHVDALSRYIMLISLPTIEDELMLRQ